MELSLLSHSSTPFSFSVLGTEPKGLHTLHSQASGGILFEWSKPIVDFKVTFFYCSSDHFLSHL